MKRKLLFILIIVYKLAIGQTKNEDIISWGKYPQFFPTDSVIKADRIKTITEISPLEKGLTNKLTYSYDKNGRQTKYIEFTSEDTTKVSQTYTYIYNMDFIYMVDSLDHPKGSYHKIRSETTYQDIHGMDSLKIDSGIYQSHFVLKTITTYEFNPDRNKSLKRTEKKSFEGDISYCKGGYSSIKNYKYDSLNRITELEFTTVTGPQVMISSRTWDYQKNHTAIQTEYIDEGKITTKMDFDDQGRLTHVSVDNPRYKENCTYTYDGGNVVKKVSGDGSSIDFVYKNGLPFKCLDKDPGTTDLIKEFRYEFY